MLYNCQSIRTRCAGLRIDLVYVEIARQRRQRRVFREDIVKCIEAGMDDHDGKPIEVDSMLQILISYLR